MTVFDRASASRARRAAAALSASVLLLAGCAASPQTSPPVSSDADELPAADGDALPAAGDGDGDDEDTGTVTLSIASGPHAGSYPGHGSLKCDYEGFIPGSWWVNFASDAEEEDPAVVNVVSLWLADAAHVDDEASPYPGDPFLVTLWLGNPFLGGASFTGDAESGGSLRLVTASGGSLSFAGSTADGVDFTFDAECPRVTN